MGQIKCDACGFVNSEFNPTCRSCGQALPEDAGSNPPDPPVVRVHSPHSSGSPTAPAVDLGIGPGALVGNRYQILEILGRGGMGAVFKARDTELDRFVALKIIADQDVSEERLVKELVREAKAVSALDHRNIVRVYDLSTKADSRFIAMEFIDGQTLQAVLSDRTLDFPTALEYAIALADALETAHHAGIIHRDIKPGNVMVTADDDVKILDFGLAGIRAETRSESASSQNVVSGTFNYMSPEQILGESMDPRSDIFCLGILMTEMFFARHPFQAADPVAVLHKICHEDAQFPETAASNRGVLEILQRALARNPEDRYQDMEQLKVALLALRESGSGGLGLEPAVLRRRRLIWVALVVLILLSALGVSHLITRARSNQNPETPAQAEKKTRQILAVLPFRLIGGGDEDRALCDGLLEGVTGVLTRLERDHRHFSVISSGEILEKGVTTAAEARERFKTHLVIDGSLQRMGSQLRIVVNVIDTQSGTLLRSQTVDGTADQMLQLQDQTLDAVYSLLRVEDPVAETGPGNPANSAAYEPYLKGKGAYTRYREEPGNLDRAIRFYSEALALDPEFVQAYLSMAQAYLMKWHLEHQPDNIRIARDHVEKAMSMDPERAEVWGLRGMIAEATGSYEDAVTAFKRAIALDPLSEFSRSLGEVYEALERWDEAEQIYTRYYERSGEWLLLNYLGRLYLRRGRYEDAKRVFQMAIEKRPDLAGNYQVLGVVYRRMGQYDQALAQYQRGLELEPSSELYTNIGSVFYYLGRYPDAAEAFEKALDFEPNSQSHLLWGNLGDVRRLMGLREAAIDAYQQAVLALDRIIVINPRLADYHIRKGLILAKMGRAKEALAEVEPHSETANVGLMLKIVRTYEFLGDRESACRYLGKAFALGLNPSGVVDDPDLADLREDSCFKTISGQNQ